MANFLTRVRQYRKDSQRTDADTIRFSNECVNESAMRSLLAEFDKRIQHLSPAACQMAFVLTAMLEDVPSLLRNWLLQRLFERSPIIQVTPAMEAAARLIKRPRSSADSIRSSNACADLCLLKAVQHDINLAEAAQVLYWMTEELLKGEWINSSYPLKGAQYSNDVI